MTTSVTDLVQVPEEVAVMLLPGLHLFPGSLLPLYIFEERYRVMLEDALEAHRMFAVGARRAGGEGSEIGGLGIVRACVRNDDGTSNLVLQGLTRIRFRRWRDQFLYPSALIEPVPSQPNPGNAALRKKVLGLCLRLPEQGVVFPAAFDEHLRSISEAGLFSDVLAASLVQEADLRQELLEETSVRRRLGLLQNYLLAWLGEDPIPWQK